MGVLISRVRLRDGRAFVSWSEDTLRIADTFAEYLTLGATMEILDYVQNPTFGTPTDVRDKCMQWRKHFDNQPKE